MNGIIVKAIAGFYYVETGNAIYECKARGSFRRDGINPLVGDKVNFLESGIIDSVNPRKNSFTRPPIANLQQLFIISAFSNPAPNMLLIDRLISVAEQRSVEPIIVFNKSDMGDFSEIRSVYDKAGFKTFVVSCETEEGFEDMIKRLEGSISAFTGNSGVGKSSILNVLFPEMKLQTGEISEKLGRGRHTTRHVELYKIGGGYVADTPGFSSFETDYSENISKEDLVYSFRDFEKYWGKCKFSSCSHVSEKGCAVVEAVKNGEIAKSRHDSYVELYNEMKEIKPWEHKKK